MQDEYYYDRKIYVDQICLGHNWIFMVFVENKKEKDMFYKTLL